MADHVYNVLFLCTGNSARSIMAEAILNKAGKGKFRAYSAGSFPKPEVNPNTVATLGNLGYDITQFRSKSWDTFAKPGAPEFDFIFTVCDDAAGETCPVWPGHPMTAHWGIPDPAKAQGTPPRWRSLSRKPIACSTSGSACSFRCPSLRSTSLRCKPSSMRSAASATGRRRVRLDSMTLTRACGF
jgi:arsenate reductase